MQTHTFSKTSRWRNAQFAGQYLRMIQIVRNVCSVIVELFRRRSATTSMNEREPAYYRVNREFE